MRTPVPPFAPAITTPRYGSETELPQRPESAYEEWGVGPSATVGLVEVDRAPALPSVVDRSGRVTAPPRDASAPLRVGNTIGRRPLTRGGTHADIGVRAQVGSDTSLELEARDAVATALETVALRVRTGELEPRGFEPGMGDAAAVATALTALLLSSERR